MRRCSSFALAALAVLLAACSPAPDAAPAAAAPSGDPALAARRVTELADAYVRDYFEAYPEEALSAGAPEVHPDRLGEHGLAALARWQAREDQLLAELHAVPRAAVGERPEGVTYDLLQNQLEAAQRFRVCRMELWNVSPTYTGWQAGLSVLAGMQATATEAEQRAALARFSGVPRYLQEEIDNLREGLRLGYRAPVSNVTAVIEQMETLLQAPISDSPFVRMAALDAPAFRAQLEELDPKIRAAIAAYRDFLRATYLPAARPEIGVSANPDGAACYRAAVAHAATVDMTPDDIYALGKAQIERIEGEMRAIGKRSFATDDPAALLRLVKTDPRYRFASRAELIACAEAAVERARLALPRFFGRIPRAPVVVEPYPSYLEKTAPGGEAVPPTPDGKPGKYLINAYEATAQSRAGLESTAFHEAYPGHHLQGCIALERADLHPLSRYFFLSGFGEGWALYSERLADEMGLFSGDVDRVGLLSNEALRAARLVVDSGIHAFGWSRQQAIDYLNTHTAESPASAAAEIDRYIAVPGQATAYMIGNLELRRLRAQAEQALGARFDLRAFHDLLLADGALPLWAVRAKVERWIAAQP